MRRVHGELVLPVGLEPTTCGVVTGFPLTADPLRPPSSPPLFPLSYSSIKRQTIANLPPARASPLTSPLIGVPAEWSLSPQSGVVRSGVGSPLAKRSTQFSSDAPESFPPHRAYAPDPGEGIYDPAPAKRSQLPSPLTLSGADANRITRNGNRTRVSALSGQRTHPCAIPAYIHPQNIAPQQCRSTTGPYPKRRKETSSNCPAVP